MIHRMLLGKGANYACLPYDNWTTKAARATRDKTRESGLIPLTHVQHTEYEVATREIRKRLDEAGHFLSSTTGHSELAIAWQEPTPNGPVDCRCMIDHVDLERGLLYEVKIVDDAHPEAIERSAENLFNQCGFGYDHEGYCAVEIVQDVFRSHYLVFKITSTRAERKRFLRNLPCNLEWMTEAILASAVARATAATPCVDTVSSSTALDGRTDS